MRKSPWLRVMKYTEPLPTGCLRWTGTKLGKYGSLWIGHKTVLAHRWVYAQLVGQIDPDLELDHLCRNTLCVNPYHLEMVTRQENIRRSAVDWRKYLVECKHGHKLEGDNVYIRVRNGREGRSCITCMRERTRAWRERQSA